MSNIDYNAILNTIVEASKRKGSTDPKNILKTDTIGNTIVGRLVPNLKDVANSILHYYHHGWRSKLDGSGIFQLCPYTFGGKCPTCARSTKLWKSTDPVEKQNSIGIRRRENYMVNFYVIADKANPKNNNTLKLLKYGKQISDKIKLATEGMDKEIYGEKVWRLDELGCNFRIICEQNSSPDKNKNNTKEVWPTYSNSSFLPASRIEGMTDERIQEILESVFDLSKLFPTLTWEQMTKEMDKHYFVNGINDVQTTMASVITTDPVGKTLNEDKPADKPAETPAVATVTNTQPSVPVAAVDNKLISGGVNEDQLDKMLEELQGT